MFLYIQIYTIPSIPMDPMKIYHSHGFFIGKLIDLIGKYTNPPIGSPIEKPPISLSPLLMVKLSRFWRWWNFSVGFFFRFFPP